MARNNTKLTMAGVSSNKFITFCFLQNAVKYTVTKLLKNDVVCSCSVLFGFIEEDRRTVASNNNILVCFVLLQGGVLVFLRAVDYILCKTWFKLEYER